MFIFSRSFGADASRSNLEDGSFRPMAKSTWSTAAKLRDEINAQLYSFYSEVPSSEKLDRTWKPLLENLLQFGCSIGLITTNYDVVLEKANSDLDIEFLHSLQVGWDEGPFRKLDPRVWDKPLELGLLTELYGSSNWTSEGKDIYVGGQVFSGPHEKLAIIYPGFKGFPEKGIFLSLHEHFRKSIKARDAILFVRYAFRDNYINELCSREIANECKVATINPSKKLELPFNHPLNKTKHIRKGFDVASVNEGVAFLNST